MTPSMNDTDRLATALDAHLTEFAVIIGGANVAAGIGLTTTGYLIGAINLVVGLAVAFIAMYQARRGGGGGE